MHFIPKKFSVSFLIIILNLCSAKILFSQQPTGLRSFQSNEFNLNSLDGNWWPRKSSRGQKDRSKDNIVKSDEPMVRIAGHDQPMRWGGRFDNHPVEVSTNCDEAELFLNGNSQGVISRSSEEFANNGFQWNVRFNEFRTQLKVVARKGDVVVSDQLEIIFQTQEWGKPYRLLPELLSIEDDIATVTLVVLDENGVLCLDDQSVVKFSLVGKGDLTGYPATNTCTREIQTINGMARINIKLNGGESVLALQTDGLPVAFISLAPAKECISIEPKKLGTLSLFHLPSQDELLHYMNLVADWQLENLPEPLQRPGSNNPPYWYDHFDWTNASFYTGVMAHWRTTGNQKYFDKMMEFSEEINFQPGTRLLHADDHIIGQIYAEIYMENKDRRVIQPMLDTFDKIMETHHKGRDIWYWCDALYMAPPTLVLLSKVTGDNRYIDFMDELWWDATDLLYDTEEKLYFRDNRFVIKPNGSGRREMDGSKVFWSRGNGWVLGGLARVLEYMPQDYPSREKYENLFREMSARITSLQEPDGLWRSSLLYPEFNQAGESSGTAFFAYGLAWGVNQGLLCEETYMPYILRSWNGLVNNVHPNGKLGWTQQIGFAPDEINADMSEVYGAGAFLLAGSELVKYVNKRIGLR
jgi:unsaturated rhamnogalacturonyl hydrolase